MLSSGVRGARFSVLQNKDDEDVFGRSELSPSRARESLLLDPDKFEETGP